MKVAEWKHEEAKELAKDISASSEWNIALLEKFVRLADLEEEWAACDPTEGDFELVVKKACEVLDIPFDDLLSF